MIQLRHGDIPSKNVVATNRNATQFSCASTCQQYLTIVTIYVDHTKYVKVLEEWLSHFARLMFAYSLSSQHDSFSQHISILLFPATGRHR